MSFPFWEVNWQGLLIKVKSNCLSHTSWLSGSFPLVSHLLLTHVLPRRKMLWITHLTLMQTLMISSFSNQIWEFVCDTNKYVLWAVILPVKFFRILHTCFPLFPLEHKDFHKCRKYALGESMVGEFAELQVDKIPGDFVSDCCHFSRRCVAWKLPILTFRAHPSYNFVTDIQFFKSEIIPQVWR